jgi:hypothetical protein
MSHAVRHRRAVVFALALSAVFVIGLARATGDSAVAAPRQPRAQISKSKGARCRLNPKEGLPSCATPRVLSIWVKRWHYLPCPWVWGEVEKRITTFKAQVTAMGYTVPSLYGSEGSYICSAVDQGNMLVKRGHGRIDATNQPPDPTGTHGQLYVEWTWTQIVTLTKKGQLRSAFSDLACTEPSGGGAIDCPFLPAFS